VVDAGMGWLAVIMAVNVVIALYYYLVWTARLFQPAPEAVAARHRIPGALVGALALAAALGVVLSVDPQIVLQLASGTLFG
jgi:NADH-quinone oxidoreductase subunit N